MERIMIVLAKALATMAVVFAVFIAVTAAGETTAYAETWTELGEYKISHYCNCERCCGKTDGITASGTRCTRYRTVAMKNVPLGTTVYIEGYGYRIVEDTGGGLTDKQVDVFTPSHQHAKEMGVRYRKVWIVTE